MNFQKPLAELVMSGRKTVTRRAVSPNPRSPWFEGGCRLVVGRDYSVCPGRGKNQIGRVVVRSISREPLRLVCDTDAAAEGFGSVAEFRAAWTLINGSYDPETLVWRVAFEVHRG